MEWSTLVVLTGSNSTTVEHFVPDDPMTSWLDIFFVLFRSREPVPAALLYVQLRGLSAGFYRAGSAILQRAMMRRLHRSLQFDREVAEHHRGQ